MTETWVASLTVGLALGTATAMVVRWYLLRSRSDRLLNNRFAIRLGQVVVVTAVCGGLLMLQVFHDRMGIKRHSASYYAAIYAFLFSCFTPLFFVLRGELRWRKSVQLEHKSSALEDTNKNRPS
jgi:hypothetical protein